jgi:hypothetical protein
MVTTIGDLIYSELKRLDYTSKVNQDSSKKNIFTRRIIAKN